MAQKYAALGIELWIGDGGSPELYSKVASCGDFSGPAKKRDTLESTTHDVDGTDGGYKTYIASLKDGSECTFPVWLDPNEASHNSSPTVVGTFAGGLDYLFEKGYTRSMVLAWPTSPDARVAFRGMITGLGLEGKVGGGLMFNCTIKVTGSTTILSGLAHKSPNVP